MSKEGPRNQAGGSDSRTCRFAITAHAVKRCQQRIAPQLSRASANELLGRLASEGRVRPHPRRWMRGHVRLTPGLRFIYWSELPGVCGLAVGSTLVTVVTRSLYRRRPSASLVWVQSLVVDTESPTFADELEGIA
jgi:hypothetical protein